MRIQKLVLDEINHSDVVWTGFYAGLSPAIVGITPYMGLNFALYESFKNVAELPFFKSSKKDDSSSFVLGLKSLGKKGVCGGLAGGLSKFIVYPLVRIAQHNLSKIIIQILLKLLSIALNIWLN